MAKLPLPFPHKTWEQRTWGKFCTGRAIVEATREGMALLGHGFASPGTVCDTPCPLPPTTMLDLKTQLLPHGSFSGSPVALAGCVYHWVESYRKRIIFFFFSICAGSDSFYRQFPFPRLTHDKDGETQHIAQLQHGHCTSHGLRCQGKWFA